LPKAKLFLYHSSSQTPAATAAYLNKKMQQSCGSLLLEMVNQQPQPADLGR